MSKIKDFIREETMACDQVADGAVDIRDESVRDNINSHLMRATSRKFITPYVALEKISKSLSSYHIHIPRQSFMEGEMGVIVIPANQFGEKFGMNNDGSVVTTPDLPYNIFFEWQVSDCGMFEIFCQLVDDDELDEILEDIEDEETGEGEEEMNEETLNELDPKVYRKAKQILVVRKKNADAALKSGHDSPVLKKFSDSYGKSIDRADRLIAKKKTSDTVAESDVTNKFKKKMALIKNAGKKPEVANDGKAVSRIRKSPERPTVNQFDIRNLKIAEENDYEVIHNGKKKNIKAASSSEAQRKAEKEFGLKPKFKQKGMTIATKTVKEENDYEVIHKGQKKNVKASSSSEAQTKAEKEFDLKPKFKHKGMTIAPKTVKEEELDEGISKMIKNVKRGLKGWPSAGLDPKEANKDRPKDVVRRAKQIAKDDPKMAEKIAKSETGKGSPADLQRRVIRKALTKSK